MRSRTLRTPVGATSRLRDCRAGARGLRGISGSKSMRGNSLCPCCSFGNRHIYGTYTYASIWTTWCRTTVSPRWGRPSRYVCKLSPRNCSSWLLLANPAVCGLRSGSGERVGGSLVQECNVFSGVVTHGRRLRGSSGLVLHAGSGSIRAFGESSPSSVHPQDIRDSGGRS